MLWPFIVLEGVSMTRCIAMAAIVLASLHMPCATAQPTAPNGTWLVNQRIAFDIYPCQNALCGRIAWLRNPALRTTEMCGRLLVWGLTANGPQQWGGGWFFDPENGATYDLSARMLTIDRISARIYRGIALVGRTELLTRIKARSLPGWCAAASD
jgi:uncharacterized protein (DUF2147 family)